MGINSPQISRRTVEGIINLCESPKKPRHQEIVCCPVCNKRFLDLSEKQLTAHIDECLTNNFLEEEERVRKEERIPIKEMGYRLSEDRVRFVVQELDEDVDESIECTICFEPFLKDESVATLECLCLLHEKCLNNWLQRSHFCPLHIPNEFEHKHKHGYLDV